MWSTTTSNGSKFVSMTSNILLLGCGMIVGSAIGKRREAGSTTNRALQSAWDELKRPLLGFLSEVCTQAMQRLRQIPTAAIVLASVSVMLMNSGTTTNNSGINNNNKGGMIIVQSVPILALCGSLLWSSSQDENENEDGKDDESSPTNSRSVQQTSGQRSIVEPSPSNIIYDTMSPTAIVTNTTSQYCEVLVHNISHTDLILSLHAPHDNESASDDKDAYCLCRPRFSAFASYSQRVLHALPKDNLRDILIQFPCHQRSEYRYDMQLEPSPFTQLLPIGFKLSDSQASLAVSPQDLNDLRVRGRDASRVCSNTDTTLNAVFFPLLATLLPRWHQRMAQKYQSPSANIKKVLILVSGVGTPRNWTHSMTGNSTQLCAELCKQFIETLYPDVTVVTIHSTTSNIFRYDDNISFVHRKLLPTLQLYRDAHAQHLPYPDELSTDGAAADSNIINVNSMSQTPQISSAFSTEWKKSFTVTLSFADGSPARNHAIQAALRPFRPIYFHFWQLKTFWHSLQIVLDDLEIHSFEEMNATPALEVSKVIDKLVKQMTNEILSFQRQVSAMLASNSKDLDLLKFWLRKTHKPVLAVLAVQLPEWKKPKFYRGTNMEVSMPTGSLCAERNVIGTALAEHPTLRRQDLKCIAVLAVPLPTRAEGNTSADDASSYGTAGQTQVQLSRANSVASIMDLAADEVPPSWVATATTTTTTKVAAKTGVTNASAVRRNRQDSISEHSALGEDEDWILHSVDKSIATQTLPLSVNTVPNDAVPPVHLGAPSALTSTNPPRQIALYESSAKVSSTGKPQPQTDSQPSSFTKSGKAVPSLPLSSAMPYTAQRRKTKRTVVIHSENDINPLKPCGACNEWLKKIAESNPYFRILTFTDKDCNGVYCTPCEE